MNGNVKTPGKVKFYNRTKGYGFIERAGDSDVFVHAKDLPLGVTELLKDQRVNFEVEDGHKGLRAKKVELI